MLKINEANFPDKSFREYISDTFDENKKGYLTKKEIENIEDIDLSLECDIKNIKGIEHFPNLITLACSDTNITEIDVSKNQALKHLDCSCTNIDKLDISQNSALITLDCGKTEITEINVSQNPALKHLDCYGTNIDKIDVSQNPKLNVVGNKDLSIIKESSSIQDKIKEAKDTLVNKKEVAKDVKGKEQER